MSQNISGWDRITAKFELKARIEDLKKVWAAKCNVAFSNLCLQDVTKPYENSTNDHHYYYNTLSKPVKDFLKTLYKNIGSEHDPADNGKIIERHIDISDNHHDGAIANFVYEDYFLGLVRKYNLETKHSKVLKILKTKFGKKLGRDCTAVTKLLTTDWKELATLDHDLWEQILITAKIDTNKEFDRLSEEEIFNIINSHPDIFNLHKQYKKLTLYPEFWNEIHEKDPVLTDLENRSGVKIPKQNDDNDLADWAFERMDPSLKSFWDMFSKNTISDIYEQLQNYFKGNSEERKNHILKKILTKDFVNINGVLNTNLDKNKYNDLGDFIKKQMKRLVKNEEESVTENVGTQQKDDKDQQKIEFIYYTLGEFFDGAFIDVIGKDNIKKYYEDNKIESDLFSEKIAQTNSATHKRENDADPKQIKDHDNKINKPINQNSNPENNQDPNIIQSGQNMFHENPKDITNGANQNINDDNKLKQIKNDKTDESINQNSNPENDQDPNIIQGEQNIAHENPIETAISGKIDNENPNNEIKNGINHEEKLANIDFYKKCGWGALIFTILSGIGVGVGVALSGALWLMWLISIPAISLIITIYCFYKFDKLLQRQTTYLLENVPYQENTDDIYKRKHDKSNTLKLDQRDPQDYNQNQSKNQDQNKNTDLQEPYI